MTRLFIPNNFKTIRNHSGNYDNFVNEDDKAEISISGAEILYFKY